MNILFVCLGNLERSPSFEAWFKLNKPQYKVKSAGTDGRYPCPHPLTNELLEWADKVFVMDIEQELYINKHHHDFLSKVEIIGVSDDYARSSTRINQIIHYWVIKKGL